MFLCVCVCVQEFLLQLERNDLIGSILRADTNHQQLVRDQFNTRKLVVVVTVSGKVRVNGCGW